MAAVDSAASRKSQGLAHQYQLVSQFALLYARMIGVAVRTISVAYSVFSLITARLIAEHLKCCHFGCGTHCVKPHPSPTGTVTTIVTKHV